MNRPFRKPAYQKAKPTKAYHRAALLSVLCAREDLGVMTEQAKDSLAKSHGLTRAEVDTAIRQEQARRIGARFGGQ